MFLMWDSWKQEGTTWARVFSLAPGVSMASAVDRLKGENTRFLDFSKSLNNKLPNLLTPFVTKREGGRFLPSLLVIISFTWDSDILGQSSAACIGLEWNIYERNVLSKSFNEKDSSMLLQIDQCQENDEDSVQCSSHWKELELWCFNLMQKGIKLLKSRRYIAL